MPRDQKPRRSNEENNDDDNNNDNYDAIVVLIASVLFLFLHLAFQQFYTSVHLSFIRQKEYEQERSVISNQLYQSNRQKSLR